MGKSRVLVHLHLYRVKQLKRLAKYARNIISSSCQVKIIVTITENDVDLKSQIATLIPEAELVSTINCGYDVGPFFQVLKRVDLNEFDYVVKIHSKDNRIGIISKFGEHMISRYQWPRILLDAISPSSSFFEKNIQEFEKDPKLGLIGSSYLIVRGNDDCQKIDSNLLKRLNIDVDDSNSYIAGTMFIVRASLLNFLKEYNCLDERFEDSVPGVKGGTLAHAYERILGWLVGCQGYTTKGFDQSWWKTFTTSKFIGKLKKFFLNRRITDNGYLLIRVCLIPVYNKKIKRD